MKRTKAKAPDARGPHIVRVEIKAWQGAKFTVEEEGTTKDYVSSVSEVVAAALVAFFADSDVELIPYENSNVVQRVYAFRVRLPDSDPPPKTAGEWAVSRMATQTNPQSGNHLEAFLFRDDPMKETAFNLYEPLLQHAVLAAAHAASRFDVKASGGIVDAIRLARGPNSPRR